MTDPRPGRRPPADGSARLLAALALPTALGAVGLHGAGSLAAAFLLYAAGGCVLAPWLLVGARPFTARGGLPFAPPPAPASAPARRWRAELALGLLFGPVFLATYLAARPWLGAIADYQARLAGLGVDPGRPAVLLVTFAIFNPLLEEWWWRGQATPRCRALLGRRAGPAAVTAAFAAWHVVLLGALFPLPLALVRTLLIAGASLLWSHLALKFGGWRAPYVAHLAADLAMVALFLVVVA